MAKQPETKITFKVFNKEFNSAVNEMKSESSKLRQEFKLQEAQMAETATTSEKLQAKLDYLGKAHQVAVRKVAETERQLEKTKQQFGENSKEADKMERELLSAMTAEQKLANEIGQTNRELRNQVLAAQKARKSIKEHGDSMRNVGLNIGVAFTAAGGVVAAGLGVAVHTAMEFDAQMSRVGAIAGATKSEFEELRQSALDLGASTSKSASEVAIGQEALAALGFTVQEVLGSMPGVISAAEASGSDMAQTAEVMASTLNIFSMEATEATRVADILAQTANVSAADMTDMQYALKYAGPPAAALGISLEELAGSIGIMTNAGMKGEQAGTTLRGALLALLNPSKENSKLMETMGISITDAKGNFVGLSKLVENLSDSMEGQTDTQKAATLASIVGTEAVSGMLSLMSAGPEEIDKMTQSLENSGGVSADTAAKMKDNLKGAVDELSGAFETMQISIGTALTPALQRLAGIVQSVADWFNNLTPSTQQFIAIGAAVSAMVLILVGVVGFLVAALGALVMVEWAAVAPILGIIAAVVAVIAVFVAFGAAMVIAYQKVDWFRNGILTAWYWIRDQTKIAWYAILLAIQPTIQAIVTYVSSKLAEIKTFWASHGAQIIAVVSIFMAVVKAQISIGMAAIKAVFQVVWPVIQSIVKVAWSSIKTIIDVSMALIQGVIRVALAVISGDWSGAWNAIKSTAQTIMNSIINFFNSINLKEIGKNIIQGLINGISSMAGAAAKAARDVASSVKNSVTGFLGIHSPSRVMMEVGGFIGAGLVIGIENMKRMVQSTSEQMASWATPTISMSSVSGTTQQSMGENLAAASIPQQPMHVTVVSQLDGYEVARNQYKYIDGMMSESISNDKRQGGVK